MLENVHCFKSLQFCKEALVRDYTVNRLNSSCPLDDIITRHVPLIPVVVSVLGSSPLDDIITRHVPLIPVVVSVLGSSPLDDFITRHVPLTPVVVSVLGPVL